MSIHVLVYGAIWVNDRLVVVDRQREGEAVTRSSLPGGLISDNEALAESLSRLVREQIERDVDVGELLWAGREGEDEDTAVILIFAARLRDEQANDELTLIDPDAAGLLPEAAQWAEVRDANPSRGSLGARERRSPPMAVRRCLDASGPGRRCA